MTVAQDTVHSSADQMHHSEQHSVRLAILYGYNGTGFDALERTKGEVTIEGTLLAVLASLLSADGKATFTNISRASTTEAGEHASKQVVSFETHAPTPIILPAVEAVNKLLPSSMRVFRIIPVASDFSARRTCEARTYEFLIPTYAFSPPPAAAHYAYAEQYSIPDLPISPSSRPQGDMFKTMKHGHSLMRRHTLGKNGGVDEKSANTPSVRAVSPDSYLKEHGEKTVQGKVVDEDEPEPRGAMARMFGSCFMGLCRKKSELTGSEQLKASLYNTLEIPPDSSQTDESSVTLQRKNTQNANTKGAGSSIFKDENDEPDTFVNTLHRSMSRHKNFDPKELNKEVPPEFFDPLVIPPPTTEQKASIRGYRMSQSQKVSLCNILSLFNGTHNWHNYIPGADQSDPRCYIRIINIDVRDTELHEGMEWVRIKIQAPAFARYQVRRMMALVIMVLRTNTPHSVVANSYGFAKMEIPEAPALSLVLDEPHYNNYNVEVLQSAKDQGKMLRQPVHFGESIHEVEDFRHNAIHEAIYATERELMEFETWLRSLDSYSFLYTCYLNERGVILKNRNFIRDAELDSETTPA
ncbi:tRNA pseudouridine synthase 1 [Batrachochytrium dendrobatidis]|nr:tRNA pseudouridine synthase 1 [Batrachochytrium dendrobatidis]KAK5672218.1 tRNA pseudouridine synthase 1 [Batrachochytrium dendrobatidis]